MGLTIVTLMEAAAAHDRTRPPSAANRVGL